MRVVEVAAVVSLVDFARFISAAMILVWRALDKSSESKGNWEVARKVSRK